MFDWDRSSQIEILPKKSDVTRVLWWNIQFGRTDRELRNENSLGPLEKNLQALVEGEHAPDIMALGEYEQGVLQPQTERILQQYYPDSPGEFWPYNAKMPERGIRVYSRFPIVELKREMVDYYPLGLKDENKIAEYKALWAKNFPPERAFPREYISMTLQKEERTFHFLPFHALAHIEKEYQELGGGFLEEVRMKLRLAFGRKNPMIYQLKRFREKLSRDFKDYRAPMVMMGDFNLPRAFWGVKTAPYSVVSQGLKDPFKDKKEVTWPMPSSPEAKDFSLKLQIDHAFTNPDLKVSGAQVLPFRGSDHAALFVDVSFSSNI